MNKQGKNGIEWCDASWSPVTGCLHGCEYCYARKIAKRFGGGGYGREMGMFISKYKDDAFKSPYVLDEPQLAKTKDDWYRQAPYPFGFAPTFHKYRLNEPQQVKKPQKIFVCSMADLFGEWVPDEWIEEVFKACWKAPQHRYLFLTKNPNRYADVWFKSPECSLLGTTITCQADVDKLSEKTKAYVDFYSIEPLLGEINIKNILYWKDYDERIYRSSLDWVIIGQQTNPNKPPKPEWVCSIIDQCRAAKVPVFVKSPLYEKYPIQEFPEGLI
jgi:protein gp37